MQNEQKKKKNNIKQSLNFNVMKKHNLLLLSLALVSFVNAQNEISQVPTASTPGTLTITTTTTAPGGSYRPDHVMAIWVTNSSGTFVKTLLAYAAARKSELTNWRAATSTYNVVDALTGSTKTSHATRTCTWNGTDVSKVLVADGTYTVKMQICDGSTSNATFTFVKGPAAQTVKPANLTSFSSNSLVWAPTNTAIDEVYISKHYKIYPNPTKSYVYVSGLEIDEIELCTLEGNSIFTTKDPRLNLSALPKGTYLTRIVTKKGTFIKKIQKI
jgi:hypothetical protein